MENSATNNSGFVINSDNVRKCFEVMNIKTQQNPQIVKEAQSYLDDCKNDPQFPIILLQLFENTNENVHIRWFALIEFKNIIKKNWNNRRNYKFGVVYSPEFKKDVRSLILVYLERYQEKKFKEQINDILRFLALVEFPTHYPELVQYLFDNMQGLRETLKDEESLLSSASWNFVKILKIVLTDRSYRRVAEHSTIFNNIYFKLLEGFHEFWDYLHTNTQRIVGAVHQENFQKVLRYIKLTRKADKIYISLLSNGYDDLVENQDILKIVGLLVQRAAELTENTKNLKQLKGVVEISNNFNINLFKYLNSLSQLQTILPILFKDVLVNYIKLIEFILDNAESFSNEDVLKSAVICLTSALRRYAQYNDERSTNKKVQLEDIKKHSVAEFRQYFTAEKVENFFNIFLLKLLPKRPFLENDQDPENLDDFVEIENDQFASEFEKLETPLYNLTLKCSLELLQRFGDESIPLIYSLTSKVIQNQMQDLPNLIIDGVFAIVGLLPKAYSHLKVDPSNYLDLGSALKYLEDKAPVDQNLSKRIPVLIHKWIDLFSPTVKNEIVQNVVHITQSLQNHVVRYECCLCLKAIFKSDETLQFNYAAISESLVPIVIDLLGRFKNPQAVWGLIELMKSLFTRSQYSGQEDNLVAQLQHQNILTLTKMDDPLLLNVLVDMFKTVVASFPYGTALTSVFVICIEFIDFHFRENRFKSPLLSLWLFLVREYTDVQNVGNEMRTLFARYSDNFLNINNPEELGTFINLIEEYILAGFISPDDYLYILKIMEDKFEVTIKISDPDESIYNLKSALLSLMATLLLIVLRQNSTDNLKIFEKMLTFLLKDLLNPLPDEDFKSLKSFRASMMTLINRFIILNLNGFIEIINNYQIELGDFLSSWTKNMNYLHSSQTKHLNSIAILNLAPHIKDKQLIANYLDSFVNATLATVVAEAENGQKIPEGQFFTVEQRCADVRDSERKKELRKSGLYFDVNLKELFSVAFNTIFKENNLTLDEIKQCVADPRAVELMLQICSN